MKTTVIESKEVIKLEFPLLAKSTGENKTVVLFTDKKEGVVLSSETETYGIGHFSKEWAHCTDKEVWQILESPVTIKFEF